MWWICQPLVRSVTPGAPASALRSALPPDVNERLERQARNESLFREVNERIRAVSDRDHWGVEDRWNLPDDGAGDCEDIQLLKRKILAEEHGVTRRAMRMTVVIDDQGEGHAVLMLRTTEGELILDNKRSAILAWRARFHER